jgi:uncharacterized membrane protein YfcA
MDVTHALLLIGIGLFVGFIGTLIGAGGGFILVPVLLLLLPGLKPEVITSISLAIVFLNAASGSIAYAKMKRIDYRSALTFAVAALPGSILGAFSTSLIPERVFDLILGFVLIIIAVFLLLRPEVRKKITAKDQSKLVHRSIIDNKGQLYEYAFNQRTGIIISFVVGYLSSLLGIGGGIIHVPALTSILNFPIHVATATSHLILVIMALAGTLVHIFQGNLTGHLLTLLYIGFGVVVGAQGGAFFSHHAKPNWIIRALAFALLLVGIRIIIM